MVDDARSTGGAEDYAFLVDFKGGRWTGRAAAEDATDAGTVEVAGRAAAAARRGAPEAVVGAILARVGRDALFDAVARSAAGTPAGDLYRAEATRRGLALSTREPRRPASPPRRAAPESPEEPPAPAPSAREQARAAIARRERKAEARRARRAAAATAAETPEAAPEPADAPPERPAEGAPAPPPAPAPAAEEAAADRREGGTLHERDPSPGRPAPASPRAAARRPQRCDARLGLRDLHALAPHL